jgi:hypothetical protein
MEFTVKPDHEVARIAHEAWTELMTRKAGLLYDKEHDVVAEVYSSWYELFKQMRGLAKSVPVSRLRKSKDARLLLDTLINALNNGLRPHLTKWQARFRRWYERESSSDEHRGKTPQELQRAFPGFDELESELLAINKELTAFAAELKKIAHGRDKSKPTEKSTS